MVAINLPTQTLNASPASVAQAADVLRRGGLVAFPTETVYGLGARADNADAVALIYQAKGRPSFNPLIAHVADLHAAEALAVFTPVARKLAEKFWPGPLTLVLQKRDGAPLSDLATAGLDTVAIRVPSHPVARALLSECGFAVVAPSANRSGHVSPTLARHVDEDLHGRIDLIVDGGALNVGVESTIVGCFDQPVLLRPGGIATAEIEDALGCKLRHPSTAEEADQTRPLAPGMLTSHYAPNARVRLNAREIHSGEALLAFGTDRPAGFTERTTIMNLSERGDVGEAAANLFSHLRALDAGRPSGIAVMPIPETGLGEAINDRLRRSAAPQ